MRIRDGGGGGAAGHAGGYDGWSQSIRQARCRHAGALLAAAAIYPAPALLPGESSDIVAELAGVLLFGTIAVAAFETGALWLSIGWVIRALWDSARQARSDPLKPACCAQACLGFDRAIAAAGLRRLARPVHPDRQ